MKKLLFILLLFSQTTFGQFALSIPDETTPYTYTATPPAKTYATLNPNNKSPNVTLSGGDLTFSRNGGTGVCVSTIGVKSGIHYYEAKLNSFTTAPDFFSGVMISNCVLNANLGSTASGYSLLGDDGGYYNNGFLAFAGGSTYPLAVNDVLGFEVNMQNHTLTVYRNDVAQTPTPIFTGLTGGAYYPAFSVQFNAVNVTVNFGGSAFTYTGHTNANQGIYQ